VAEGLMLQLPVLIELKGITQAGRDITYLDYILEAVSSSSSLSLFDNFFCFKNIHFHNLVVQTRQETFSQEFFE
jgi:hypothetical protein